MGTVHSGFVIGATLAQFKKVEKVFIENGAPYFTDGTLSWDNVQEERFYYRIADGKYYVNLDKLIWWIEKHNLKQAIKDEFAGTDLVQWFKDHKELDINVFDNP
jgi:hypothetical protein